MFKFPSALRRLFATILVFCEPGNVYKLWEDHYDAMSEDYSRTCRSIEGVKQLVLRGHQEYSGNHGQEYLFV